MTDPVDRKLEELEQTFMLFKQECRRALYEAWMATEGRKDLIAQRDAHRKSLNRIADMLNVVHEDDKIIARVRELQDKLYASKLDAPDVQLICLALAECNLRRPGWSYAISELAKRLNDNSAGGAQELIDSFKEIHKDNIQPMTMDKPAW